MPSAHLYFFHGSVLTNNKCFTHTKKSELDWKWYKQTNHRRQILWLIMLPCFQILQRDVYNGCENLFVSILIFLSCPQCLHGNTIYRMFIKICTFLFIIIRPKHNFREWKIYIKCKIVVRMLFYLISFYANKAIINHLCSLIINVTENVYEYCFL